MIYCNQVWFSRISMLITFWKVYETSKRRKHHTWASFCVHSLIQPIYTIQSKIERMLFKSLCLLSPYMHHFISSIIITVLCVPKITCPCFPILGCIKNKNLQVQTITYYLPIEIKTIPIHVDALRKILKTFRMDGIYIWNYWKFSIAILGFIPSFRNIYSAFLFFQFPFS